MIRFMVTLRVARLSDGRVVGSAEVSAGQFGSEEGALGFVQSVANLTIEEAAELAADLRNSARRAAAVG
jgi:hypothetical protein